MLLGKYILSLNKSTFQILHDIQEFNKTINLFYEIDGERL